MVSIPSFEISNELVIKVIISVIILAGALAVSIIIKRRQAKIEEWAIGRALIQKFEHLGVYLVAIGIIAWLFDIPSIWFELQNTYPIVAKVVQVVILWTIVVYVVRSFSVVFIKFSEKVKKVPHEVGALILKIFRYAAYTVAILGTLGIFELTGALQGLLVGAGFAGIVVGFAARDVLGNFFAGISLLIDRPFKIGDWVHLKRQDLVGTVKEMSLRSVTIVAPDNTPINLPNSLVASEPIVNYSAHKLWRWFLDVSISYESDIGKAMKVIHKIIEKDPALAKEPVRGQGIFGPPEVVVNRFGESSIDLQVKVFIDTTLGGGKFETKSRMLKNIKEALVKAGVEIPYPRRVIMRRKIEK